MAQDYNEVFLQAMEIIVKNELQKQENSKASSLSDDQEVISVSDPFIGMLLVEKYTYDTPIELTSSDSYFPIFTWTPKDVAHYDKLGISCLVNSSSSSDPALPIKDNIVADAKYGIRVTIYGVSDVQIQYFDSLADMPGEITSFNGILHKKVLDLTNFTKVQAVTIEGYNFWNSGTVTFSNLAVSLGNSLVNYNSEMEPLTISALDNITTYQSNEDGNLVGNPSVTLAAQYIYEKSAGLYDAFTYLDEPSKQLKNITIRWYRYKPDGSQFDQWGGTDWTYISLDKEKEEINSFSCSFDEFDPKISEEKFKAVVIHNDYEADTVTTYTSNIITLKNELAPTMEWITNRQITFEDGSNGLYALYDYDGRLTQENEWQAYELRTAKLTYSTELTKGALCSKIKSLTWKVPTGHVFFKKASTDLIWEETIEGDYNCYTLSKSSLSDENVLSAASSLHYTISEERLPYLSADKVICIIVIDDKEYMFEHRLELMPKGTNGTDYTIVIRMVTNDGRLRTFITPDETLYFQVHIYDSDCKEIELDSNNQKVEFVANCQEKFSFDKTNLKLTTYSSLNSEDDDYDYGILTYNYTFNDDKKLIIQKRFIVATSNSKNVRYAGPTIVTYNSAGNNPQYINHPVQLQILDKDGVIQSGTDATEITSKINFTGDVGENAQINYSKNFPTIEDAYLRPRNVYDKVLEQYRFLLILTAKDANSNTYKFVQPILLEQSRYFSSIINEWDGALEINEDGNYILASAYVAGEKNEENQFTGVITGTLGTIVDEGEDPNLESGIFGYQAGVQSFGLRSDGTAFFGTPSSGRIEFDGNRGVIQSGNYKEKGDIDYTSDLYFYYSNGVYYEVNKDNHSKILGELIYNKDKQLVINKETGMNMVYSESDGPKAGLKIDLDDGIIDGPFFRLDNNGASIEGEIHVSEGGNIGGWYVGQPSYQNFGTLTGLTSAGFKNSLFSNQGSDLMNGVYTTVLNSSHENIPRFAVYLNKYNSSTNSFSSPEVKFSVDKQGKIYAADADIRGKIQAESGYIGGESGWEIQDNLIVSYSKHKDSYWSQVGVGIQSYSENYNGGVYNSNYPNASTFLAAGFVRSDSTTWVPDVISGVTDNGQTRTKFWVGLDGTMYAKNATIEGVLKAGNGSSVGSWNVGTVPNYVVNGTTKFNWAAFTNSLYSINSNQDYVTIIRSSNSLDHWRFVVANYKTGVETFGVKGDGKLFASNAEITGKITIEDGSSIGGWEINKHGITKDNTGLNSDDTFILPSLRTAGNKSKVKFYSGQNSTKYSWTSAQNYPTEIESQSDALIPIYSKNSALSGSYSRTAIRTLSGNDMLQSCSIMGYTVYKNLKKQTGIHKVDSVNEIVGDNKIYINIDKINSNTIGVYVIGSDNLVNNDYKVAVQYNAEWIVIPYAVLDDGSLYASSISGSIVENSDKRLKADINLLSDKYDVFFDNLKPCRYHYIDGTSNRFHTGFIAQEVLKSMDIASLTTQDIAAVVAMGGKNKEENFWGLRYTEFVSLNTWQIQKLKNRVTELEKLVYELKNK